MSPLQEGPVGPFPDGADPDEYDRLRRRVMWKMPTGLFVIGSRAGDRRNLMTANLVVQVSHDPKLVAATIEKDAVTNALVKEGGVFVVNIIDREDRAIVRKFTKPVEQDGDNSLNGFAFHDGRTGAPILDPALAYLECELRNTVELGSHTLFLGEVVDAAFQKPEDTEVLRMEDTRMNYGG